jgi:hypothetical protein
MALGSHVWPVQTRTYPLLVLMLGWHSDAGLYCHRPTTSLAVPSDVVMELYILWLVLPPLRTHASA